MSGYSEVEEDPATSRRTDTLAPDATWEAAEHTLVLAWWQMTDFLAVDGPEAATFLDGVATQDMAGTAVGTARHALFLNNKARIIAPVVAYRASEERFLLEGDPALLDELAPHLKRYKLRAKATIERTDLVCISLIGPDAAARGEGPGWFDSSSAWGLPARTYIGDAPAVSALVGELEAGGIGCADPEALDALRIARATPSLTDLRPGFMPAEVGGMEVAVALDKGCYLGQEPVARLHYRGKPNRTLRQIELSAPLSDAYFAEHDPESDDYLALVPLDDPSGRARGTLTSWATRPDGSLTGLAILRREVEPGNQLLVAGSEVIVTAR
jgi:folate-binding protein YgfZ